MSLGKAYKDFKTYMALKLHFDPANSYDYFKYNGVIKVSEASFQSRKDSTRFYAFERKIKDRDAKDVLLAYALKHYKVDWIGKINSSPDLLDNADNYTRLLDNIYEELEVYCRALFTMGDHPFDCFKSDGRDSFPIIVNEVIAERLPKPIYVVLNKALPFHHRFQIDDPIIFDELDYILRQYEGFVDVDAERCRSIIRTQLEALENLEH